MKRTQTLLRTERLGGDFVFVGDGFGGHN
jgi:hypothetical protein